MKSKIFRGRVPYDEALHRLNAEFSPKPGDLITHEELEKVIQARRGDGRYYGVLNAWIRQLRRRGIAMSGEGRARGIGRVACLPHETTELGRKKLRTTGRILKRSAAIMDMADTSLLKTEQDLQAFNLTRRELHLAAADIAQRNTVLKPPPSVQGGNVRLLKNG